MDRGPSPPRRRYDHPPVNAEQLRGYLLEVLTAASAPISTTQARLAVIETRRRGGRAVVTEEVYRALVILAQRGAVRRAADRPGRAVHWELNRSHLWRQAALSTERKP